MVYARKYVKRYGYGGAAARYRSATQRRPGSNVRIQAAMRRGYYSVPRARGALVSQAEAKYFNTGLTPTIIQTATSWAGTVQDPATFNTLCVPIKGAGINERIGRKIAVTKIRIRGFINQPRLTNQTLSTVPSTVRLLLVQDTQANGTQPGGTSIMAAPQIANAKNAVSSFQSLDNFGRFRVLKDKTMTIQNPNGTFDGTNIEINGLNIAWKMNVKFRKPVVVHFNNTNGGTVADIVDNAFHIYALTDAQNSTGPTLSYESRVVYKDL